MKPYGKTQLLLILTLCSCWSLAWAGWSETVKFPDPEKPMALFNGRDLSGWQGQVSKYWSVEQGTIRGANKDFRGLIFSENPQDRLLTLKNTK